MSRIIVKNLPEKITTEKLHEHFGQKGVITDVQLKFTPDGKFRRFAFIGFQNESDALSATDYFDKTYLNSSRIVVQQCAQLGDENKPRSWSKYCPESTAYKKSHKIITPATTEATEGENNEKRKKIVNPVLQQFLDKYKDDPTFLDYLEVHGKNKVLENTISELYSEEEEEAQDESKFDDKIASEEKDDGIEIAINPDISDIDYLKLKTKKKALDEIKPVKNDQFYTLVLRGLPYKIKKKAIKEFFRPLKVDSIRIPPKIKGLAYVGFKTEDCVKKALLKNKSFINGKQIFVYQMQLSNRNKSEKSDESNSGRNEKWKRQTAALENEECIAESGRIFIRNLPYTVTEEELQQLFEKYGPVTETIVPIDKITRTVKGFAVVTFLIPEHAVKAYSELDGTIFHGRMLHLLPGKAKESQDDLAEKEGSSFKTKKLKKLKEQAKSSHNWNTLFLGQNAVADLVSSNYEVSKEELLFGENAAVRIALGETQLVNNTRDFLVENGVKLDVFNQVVTGRSKTVILVKNLPADTEPLEIRNLFGKFGLLGRVLLPPNGITAIVEFLEVAEARTAFRRLAYSKFKNLPLYLEWAPDNLFTTEFTSNEDKSENKIGDDDNKNNTEFYDEDEEPEPDTTLFIKNLSFDTTEDKIKEHFKDIGRIANITVARKKDPARPGVLLSMGYGFIQFYKQVAVTEAMKKLQQSVIDDHTLELKRSNRTLQDEKMISERKKNNVTKQTGSKILVRNIPFQAKQSEILELFKTFGEIKAVRMPKKMVGSGPHRGFGFIEYYTKADAKRAMQSLCQSTHLYGRRLVLEWAQTDDHDVEYLRKRTMEQFQSSPTKKIKKSTADLIIADEEM